MTANVNAHRRLRSVTCDIEIPVGDRSHKFEVSLAYDEDEVLREIIFVGRGKIGQQMDDMFRELGIQLSRAIQDREPMTGKAYGKPGA